MSNLNANEPSQAEHYISPTLTVWRLSLPKNPSEGRHQCHARGKTRNGKSHEHRGGERFEPSMRDFSVELPRVRSMNRDKKHEGGHEERSRRATGVAVVQTADHRDADDRPKVGRLHVSVDRTIAVQTLMRARPMIIVQIIGDQTIEMPFAEDDEVVQTVSPHGTYVPLRHGILPRRPCRSQDFLKFEISQARLEDFAIDRVAVADQILRWGGVERERFADLNRRPRGRGIGRDVEMQNASTIVRQDEEHVQQPKCRRRHDEEIDRRDFLGVLRQEFLPGQRWQLADTDHVLGHRRFRHFVPQQLQLRLNLGRAGIFVPLTRSRVGPFVRGAKAGDRYVRVDLRGRQALMAQQFLHAANVGPAFEQVRGETVP